MQKRTQRKIGIKKSMNNNFALHDRNKQVIHKKTDDILYANRIEIRLICYADVNQITFY